MKYTLLVCFASGLLVPLLPYVTSTMCYICNNVNSTDKCGPGPDPVDKSFLKNCSLVSVDLGGSMGKNYSVCRKIVSWIDFDVNNNSATQRVERKCGWMQTKYDKDCYYRGGYGGRQQVCSCSNEDGCNSALSNSVNTIVVIVGTVLAFAVKKP